MSRLQRRRLVTRIVYAVLIVLLAYDVVEYGWSVAAWYVGGLVFLIVSLTLIEAWIKRGKP